MAVEFHISLMVRCNVIKIPPFNPPFLHTVQVHSCLFIAYKLDLVVSIAKLIINIYVRNTNPKTPLSFPQKYLHILIYYALHTN